MTSPIREIVILALDGPRTVSFHPPRSLEEIGEANLGTLIGDVMHWPPGAHGGQQLLGKLGAPIGEFRVKAQLNPQGDL